MKKLKEMDKHMKRWIVILITALAAMLAWTYAHKSRSAA